MHFLLMSASCRQTAQGSSVHHRTDDVCLPALFSSTAPHCFYPLCSLCLFCCLASLLPHRAPGPITMVQYRSISELAPSWKKKKMIVSANDSSWAKKIVVTVAAKNVRWPHWRLIVSQSTSWFDALGCRQTINWDCAQVGYIKWPILDKLLL